MSTFRPARRRIIAAATLLLFSQGFSWNRPASAEELIGEVSSPARALVVAVRLDPPDPPPVVVPTDPAKPIFPMQTSPRCAILDNFGDVRSSGRTHEGTDILATLGQEIYAVVDGTLGQQVSVDNPAQDSSLSGNGWGLTAAKGTTYYAYMHLSAFAPGLANGTVVRQGQLIGYVGDTGNPGPGNYHLHFEVHPLGWRKAAVNPLTILTVPSACTVS